MQKETFIGKQVILVHVVTALVEASSGTISALGHFGCRGQDLANEDSFKITVVQLWDSKEEMMTSVGGGATWRRGTDHTDPKGKGLPGRGSSTYKGIQVSHSMF